MLYGFLDQFSKTLPVFFENLHKLKTLKMTAEQMAQRQPDLDTH